MAILGSWTACKGDALLMLLVIEYRDLAFNFWGFL
jgi:hypothetical protein